MIDKAKFYKAVRSQLFKGSISTKQFEGLEAILVAYSAKCLTDKRWLAYILATAYHETGAKMQPVREGFATSDKGSIAHVTALYNRKRISKNYALPSKNGKSHYGRGLVQLTHGSNYINMGKILGLPLYDKPELLLTMIVSVEVLIEGMTKGKSSFGDFTGKALENYFTDIKSDWIGARRIINGTDCAESIAEIAKKFYNALTIV